VPEPLARVIMQNLAKRPHERASDARALGRALVDASRRAALGADDIGLSRTLLGTRPTHHVSAAAVSLRAGGEPGSDATRARRHRARFARRAATFVACFFLGIGAALAIAAGFGAFDAAPSGELP
jgi:hypothetical protein